MRLNAYAIGRLLVAAALFGVAGSAMAEPELMLFCSKGKVLNWEVDSKSANRLEETTMRVTVEAPCEVVKAPMGETIIKDYGNGKWGPWSDPKTIIRGTFSPNGSGMFGVSQTIEFHDGNAVSTMAFNSPRCDRNPYIKWADGKRGTCGKTVVLDGKLAPELYGLHYLDYPSATTSEPIGAASLPEMRVRMVSRDIAKLPGMQLLSVSPEAIAIPSNCCMNVPPTFALRLSYKGRPPNSVSLTNDSSPPVRVEGSVQFGQGSAQSFVMVVFPSSIVEPKTKWLQLDAAYLNGGNAALNVIAPTFKMPVFITDQIGFADPAADGFKGRVIDPLRDRGKTPRVSEVPALKAPPKANATMPAPSLPVLAPKAAEAHAPVVSPKAQAPIAAPAMPTPAVPTPGVAAKVTESKSTAAPVVKGTSPPAALKAGETAMINPPPATAPIKSPAAAKVPTSKDLRQPTAPATTAPAMPAMSQ